MHIVRMSNNDYFIGCPDLWTFSGALYFCFTIGTTIGYGETAPTTFNGRLLFMFYVIPGKEKLEL